jgi:hypothetical protein
MRRHILWVVLVGLSACASSARIERSADAHAAKAKELSADGQWRAASKEQAKADKQASKANTRRGFEDAMPIVFK